MKITHIRIGHFGKLHNVEIDFTGGVNVVLGPNESGKSTIHSFIGAMLFGLDRNRGRAGKDDLYTKYKPWETPGSYQGSLDFEHEGREYRITRVFYQKEKACSCTDLTTGRQIALADDSITSLIPGLTKSAYYNTISMGQSALRCSSDFGGEVHNYIANLATSKESRIDVSDASKRLSKRCKDLNKTLKDVERDISDSEERIRELKRDEERITGLEEDRVAAKALLDKLNGEMEQMKSTLPDATAANNAWKISNDESEIAHERMLGAKEAYEAADSAAEALRNETERAGAEEEQALEKQAQRVSKIRNISLAVMAAGIILCIFSNQKYPGGLAAGVSLVGAAIVGLIAALLKKREMKKAREEADTSNKEAEAKLQQAVSESEQAEQVYKAAEEEYKAQNARLKKAAADLSAISEEREKHVEAERELNTRIASASASLERAVGGIDAIGDIGDALFEEENRLNELTLQKESLSTDLSAYSLALSTIEDLSQNIHDSFSSEFNDILSEEICLATDGKYSSGRIGDSLNIEVMSGIDYIPAEQLSNGACEQLYLALRFAVAKLFFADTEVPILLDESFAYSDDNRLRSVMSAIADRENEQIVIFSCIGREAEILKELGAEFNEIRLE